MSRANVEQSLGAAEQALEHFVASLDRAGFAEGADAYRRMAEVIVGQWLWTEQESVKGLEPGFLKVARLAAGVAERLRPYVAAMDQLHGLRGLAAQAAGVEPGSLAEQIVAALAASARGLTASELRKVTGASTTALRRELRSLAERGLIGGGDGRARRFVLATGRSGAQA